MEATCIERNISWPAVGVLTANHLLGFLGVYYAVVHASWGIIIAAVAYFFLCHVSIAFLHRGFTHKAFRVVWAVAIVTMALFSATGEGPAWWWRGKHLDHHVSADIPGKDPHTPNDGFFHSHMGWLCTTLGISPPTRRSSFLRHTDEMDRAVLWQRQYYWPLTITMIIVVPTGLGWLLGDALGGFLVIGFARLLFQNHMTWVVNSIGHTYGERVTSRGQATNFSNWPLGIPFFGIATVGESHHGNHHKDANTWRLGTRWYHFDVAAWVIQMLIWIGLATDIKKA